MNYGKKHDLPFGIMDVAGLLRLNIRRRAPGQVYVDCPICGDRRGKMNLNTAKDLWRCNYCGEGGGMLSLYAKVYGVSNSDAYPYIPPFNHHSLIPILHSGKATFFGFSESGVHWAQAPFLCFLRYQKFALIAICRLYELIPLKVYEMNWSN